MSWEFNSSHINSLTVSNLRADVTSDEFFSKNFLRLIYGRQLVGKRPNTIIAHYRQVIIRTNKTMLLTKQYAGV